MTTDEQKAIQEIQGTAGFRVIEFLVKKKLESLKDISNLDETISTSIESQALGRKYGKALLEEFLNDLGLYQRPAKEINKTYE